MLAGFDDVAMVAVTDTDPWRAKAFAGATGARAVAGVGALLASEVDAVYVCVPPFAHGPVEERLLAARVALFVEKPIARDRVMAERLAGLVDRARVVTSVGHHWRYSEGVDWARRTLRGRPVRLAIGAWLDQVPPVGWWARRHYSGGQVIEQAIHVLDLARLLVGEVTGLHAMADSAPPNDLESTVDGATVASLRFASGAVGTLAATCLLGWKHRAGLEVYADDLAVTLTEGQVAVRNGSAGAEIRRVDPDLAKRAADRAFVDAVLGRAHDVRTPYAEALRTHRLACAIAESADDNR